MRYSILVVDDEEVQRETLAQLLRDQGYQVVTAHDTSDASQKLSEISFDVVLTDFRMPGGNGVELVRKFHNSCPQTSFLLMTAYGDMQSVLDAMEAGVVDYLVKPISVESLLRKLEILRERRDLKLELSLLRSEVHRTRDAGHLLGDSPQMDQVRSLISQIAETKGTVLITGETGTGKEVAARQIHSLSPRKSSKFIAVNCGAIAETLLESALFGHKKGAFTGAVSDNEGFFLAANGGTLFLDEIGEMSKNLQVKLLRAIQEREVVPLGGTAPVKVDVRLLCATHRDLSKEVEEGNFRKDLFYRINVVEIKMPPLRERASDVPVLVRHLIEKFAKELGRKKTGISNDALKKLMKYSWPGNIRELENVIERAIILGSGSDLVEVEHLPAGFAQLGGDGEETLNLDEAIKGFSRVHISKVLEMCGGDKKEAAKVLGMGVSSLYRKLEELEITSKKADKE